MHDGSSDRVGLGVVVKPQPQPQASYVVPVAIGAAAVALAVGLAACFFNSKGIKSRLFSSRTSAVQPTTTRIATDAVELSEQGVALEVADGDIETGSLPIEPTTKEFASSATPAVVSAGSNWLKVVEGGGHNRGG